MFIRLMALIELSFADEMSMQMHCFRLSLWAQHFSFYLNFLAYIKLMWSSFHCGLLENCHNFLWVLFHKFIRAEHFKTQREAYANQVLLWNFFWVWQETRKNLCIPFYAIRIAPAAAVNVFSCFNIICC